jgi:O-antigen ligase
MVMVLPLLWWTVIPGRSLRNLLVVGAPGAVLGYAIYLTHSRGAFLGIAAMVLLVAHRVLGTFRTLMFVVLALGVMGIVSIGGRELSSKEESAAQRVDAWFAGWTMLKSKPLFGVGYGNFTEHHYLTAHNSFVLCFSELGLIGYFVWLGLIVLTFEGLNRAVRYAPPDSSERKFAVAFRISLTGYMACAWFLSRTYQPGLYVVLALGIAAWVCARKLVAPAELKPPIEPIPWARTTLIAVVVSIAAVYLFIALQQVGGLA